MPAKILRPPLQIFIYNVNGKMVCAESATCMIFQPWYQYLLVMYTTVGVGVVEWNMWNGTCAMEHVHFRKLS